MGVYLQGKNHSYNANGMYTLLTLLNPIVTNKIQQIPKATKLSNQVLKHESLRKKKYKEIKKRERMSSTTIQRERERVE